MWESIIFLWWVKIIATIAVGLDCYLTFYRMEHQGGFPESNPILKRLEFDTFWWYTYWVVCVILIWIVPQALFAIPAAIGSGYWAIGHWRKIRQHD